MAGLFVIAFSIWVMFTMVSIFKISERVEKLENWRRKKEGE